MAMARYTASFRMDSTGSQGHNTRELLTRSLENPERTENNIILIHADCRDAYGAIFDRAIADYNEKQTRADRRLDYDGRGYYDKVLNTTFNRATKQGNVKGEKHPYYECIVQIGNRDTQPDEETAIRCYRDYVDSWQERNPQLVLIGAYIHLDEATPHLHIDYVPVAQMKRGMKLQNSLNKAFEQLMGYTSKNAHDTAQQQFQAQERDIFRAICLEHGLEVEEPKHNDREHQTVDQYKTTKVKEALDVIKAIDDMELSDAGHQSIIQKLTRSENMVIQRDELDALKAQAAQSAGKDAVIRELQEQVKDYQGQLSRYAQGIEQRQAHVIAKEREVKTRIRQYNAVIHGDAYKAELAKVNSLRAERENLETEVSGLRQTLTGLKDELKDTMSALFSRLFIRRHQAEYDEFERAQKRDRGIER